MDYILFRFSCLSSFAADRRRGTAGDAGLSMLGGGQVLAAAVSVGQLLPEASVSTKPAADGIIEDSLSRRGQFFWLGEEGSDEVRA